MDCIIWYHRVTDSYGVPFRAGHQLMSSFGLWALAYASRPTTCWFSDLGKKKWPQPHGFPLESEIWNWGNHLYFSGVQCIPGRTTFYHSYTRLLICLALDLNFLPSGTMPHHHMVQYHWGYVFVCGYQTMPSLTPLSIASVPLVLCWGVQAMVKRKAWQARLEGCENEGGEAGMAYVHISIRVVGFSWTTGVILQYCGI